MKRIILGMIWLIACNSLTGQPLRVTSNNRFLQTLRGEAFFLLGDTAWELFHRLDREEASAYFQNRAAKGFNLIQCVLIPENEAFTLPNPYGDFPLKNDYRFELSTTPGNHFQNTLEYDYWDHAEWIIAEGIRQGMIMGVLPCWGEYVTPRFRNQLILVPEEGYDYGWYLGDRFKNYNDKIVWILGGDRKPDEATNGVEIWRAMAEGITDGISGTRNFDGKAAYYKTFMTYHCYESSSTWFENDPWIDMHAWGSYHEKRNNERVYEMAKADLQLDNPKPTLNAEPCYELLPVNYDWEKVASGRFDDFDVRQAAYWSIFSGTCGHSYGCNPVWQMYEHEHQFLPLTAKNRITWREALDENGAFQMGFLKELVTSRNFITLKPSQELLVTNNDDPEGYLVACTGDGFALIYAPTGKEFQVDFSKINFNKVEASWFNPRANDKLKSITVKDDDHVQNYDPPGQTKRGNDWVLILDNKEGY
ncbi:MAG: glycoside hydrolase family 140 protein [Candidatus Marinimicrobia bacterium]|nr:glycoside hydrolase family 140 protein [Candidatus Neomarinimicrobiota bacterium]